MTDTLFEPVSFRGLRDEVIHHVRRAILSGSVQPGHRLVEGEIARQMGVSRGPVREALQTLSREGLVVIIPRQGTFVRKISPRDAWEIFTLRSSIEGLAARLAAARMTTADVDLLQALVDRMSAAAEAGELLESIDLDLKYHEQICRSSGHDLLYQTWSALGAQLRIFFVTAGLFSKGLGLVAARQHQAVVDAFRSGDGAAAERLLSEHITRVGQGLVSQMGTD